MKEKIIVTNIQRMCLHDGPGIRTTIFLKGCNLHCPWCANPENISKKIQPYICSDGRAGIYGKEYDSEVLFKEVMKDYNFWKRNGGVTFSGGEPLLQADALREVLIKLKKQNVHITFETALMTDKSFLEICIPYTDLFIVDMKILLPDLCKEILGGNIENYFENIALLSRSKKEILFRVPCSREYTLKLENLEQIKGLLKNYPKYDVEIFALHSLARNKYESIGKAFIEYDKVSKEELEKLATELSRCGNRVTVTSL